MLDSQISAVLFSLTDDQKVRYSPATQLLLSILQDKNWNQLAWRTGLRVDSKKKTPTLPLPIMLRIDRNKVGALASDFLGLDPMFEPLGVKILPAWFVELFKNPALDRIPARLMVDAADPSLMPDGDTVEQRLADLLATKIVIEIALASQHSPLRETAMADIGMPPNATYKGKKLTGKGVVIGIIDDGCPFAHHDFLEKRTGNSAAPPYRARTVALWDQSTPAAPSFAPMGWKASAKGYGRVIYGPDIEKAIQASISPQGWIEEEKVYDFLDYPMGRAGNRTSHGARVMGIAAGNGRSVMGYPGVAPGSDIVFVQVPPVLVDLNGLVINGATLTNCILDAIEFVFAYAASVNKPAVVNLSLGGNAGSHDGTSQWEAAMDGLLSTPGRCIVASAGNAFEQDCHLQGSVRGYTTATHSWRLMPEDPTPNDAEIWYNPASTIEVSVVDPQGATHGPYPLGTTTSITDANGKIVGVVSHQAQPNGDCCALFWLFHTGRLHPSLPPFPATCGPARSGVWTLKLRNRGAATVRYHAWIQRDDTGPPGARRQSRFDPEESDPRSTICDMATGRLPIAVGAHNAATQEIAGYSAAGPTRRIGNGPPRAKPDVLAPGAEAPLGRGVMATASARAQPARLGGTSAAAPHVAGMAALILEYAQYKGVALTAAQIKTAFELTASGATLVPEWHQRALRYPKIKQATILPLVAGKGKADLLGALTYLF